MNKKARIKMCSVDKRGLGTVIDSIGARNVISAGFGTLLPCKRMRALAECDLALQGSLSRDRFEANNGLLVHAADIVDFPPGIWRPLSLPGWGSDPIVLTYDARDRYSEIVLILSTRSGATFMCVCVQVAPLPHFSWLVSRE